MTGPLRCCFGGAADYPYRLRLWLCLRLRACFFLHGAKSACDVAYGEEQALKYYDNFGLCSEKHYGTMLSNLEITL